MIEPSVCIISNDIRWQTKLNAALANHTQLHFGDDFFAAMSIIKEQRIDCVIVPVHIAFSEDLEPLTSLINHYSHIQYIIYGKVEDKELCFKLGKLGIEAYFESDQLMELASKVMRIIEQRKFKIDFSQFGIDVERCPITIKRALKMMEMDFLYIKTVTEIANKLPVSLHHFEREFTRCCRLSCKKLLLGLRLFYAVYLMENKRDLTLGQIAAESGFKEVHYFYRIFKSLTGMKTSWYRKNHCKEEFPAIFIKYVNQMKK